MSLFVDRDFFFLFLFFLTFDSTERSYVKVMEIDNGLFLTFFLQLVIFSSKLLKDSFTFIRRNPSCTINKLVCL